MYQTFDIWFVYHVIEHLDRWVRNV